MSDPFRRYRPWFHAAAVYNALWGAAVVLYPDAFMRVAGLPASAAAVSPAFSAARPSA